MGHWELLGWAANFILWGGMILFYSLLVFHDGKRGATLQTIPYRTLNWLAPGGKFWGSIPEKL